MVVDRNKRRLALIAGVVCFCLAGASGCGDVEVLPFPAGQGQAKVAPTYPPGPYGTTAQQTITNFAFQGFYAPQTDRTTLAGITLGDFYNPTGTDTYGPASPYGEGNPKPKALLIDIGAVWCGPCQQEAKVTLPPEYVKYHPEGAEFLFVLGDGAAMGVPASQNELNTWVSTFKTVYPSVIDPERSLGLAFGTAYPINILVDTRTMTIVQVVPGALSDGDPFFVALEDLLAK